MFEQGSSSVSPPLLVVVIFWLALIFCSFGLLAPRNVTVVATLCLCALSVSAAIFLVLQMYSPFEGSGSGLQYSTAQRSRASR
jgi:hypothetical protein